MKAKQCCDCNLWEHIKDGVYQDAGARRVSCEFRCNRGHSPRFYMPKSPVDTGYGYKRACNDFSKKDVEK